MKEMKQTICARCGKPATVYYRESVNGKTREMHLCAACAAKEGVGQNTVHLPGFWDDDFFGMTPLFSGLFGEPGLERSARCPRCGKTLRQIREDGRFGCSQCYESFGDQVDLRSVTGTYKGEALTAAPAEQTPKNVKEDPAARLARLKEELKKAVAAEEYEKAASLRDEIRKEADR
ncbi:MAG: UvrB/UvrC motif-containing protein [Clostridia bacterium]|nr:UvrB/UvrC motif-containing protein [Clostridia bacterium]